MLGRVARAAYARAYLPERGHARGRVFAWRLRHVSTPQTLRERTFSFGKVGLYQRYPRVLCVRAEAMGSSHVGIEAHQKRSETRGPSEGNHRNAWFPVPLPNSHRPLHSAALPPHYSTTRDSDEEPTADRLCCRHLHLPAADPIIHSRPLLIPACQPKVTGIRRSRQALNYPFFNYCKSCPNLPKFF
jgi:hypothetical protein